MNTSATATAQKPTFRQRCHTLLEERSGGAEQNRVLYLVEAALMAIIVVNTLFLILWTVDSLKTAHHHWFHVVEIATVAVFVLEYGLRLWAAPEADRSENPWRQRWRHARSGTALIDAAALMPSLAAVVVLLWHGDGLSLSFLLAVRLLTRSAKLARYLPGGRRLGMALRMKAGQMATAVFGLVVVLVIAAALMYFAEAAAQPDVFSSIPAAMWWSVVTLTTVGYGDTVPVTGVGRLLAAVIAVLGIGLFALPAGIVSAALMESNDRDGKGQSGICPHCGRDTAEPPE